jgi:hypothetical protein
MLHRAALLAGTMALGAMGTPALAAPTAQDAAFVDQFAETCTRERTSFAATRALAEADGWVAASPGDNPELAALLAFSDAAAKDIELNNGEIEFAVMKKPVDGGMRYLILSDAMTTPGNARQNIVGCYLYDFDAVAAPDLAGLNALMGAEPTQAQVDADVSSWQWSMPATLPGTADVYLTFVPEESQYREQYGFSGLVLQLNTPTASPSELPGA